MPLPSWVGQKAKPVEYAPADSPWNAPGYRIIGRDFYTCVEPPDRIADRAVIRAIRAFAPDVIPVWRKQIYKAPNSNRTFVATHLCLARYLRDTRGKRHVPYVEMPANAKHPMPNVLVRVLEDKDHPTVLHQGGPGPYQPLTMQHFRDVSYADQRPRWMVEAEEDRLREEAEEKRERAIQEERGYREKQVAAFIAKQLGAPGDELKGYMAYRALQAYRRRRMRENLGSAKPFIHVSGV